MSAAAKAVADTHDGWAARLRLELEPRVGRTVLARKRQFGPLTVQRAFYPEGATCHLYLLHPPGGVVGGDLLDVELSVAPGAHGLVTAPGAAKFYRSAGPKARQAQRLHVADGAVLEWLPPEVILFPGARLELCTHVALAGGARFIGWEVAVLGRPVIGERFDSGDADLCLRVERDGRPVLIERLGIESGSSLSGPSGLRGAPVVATMIATGAGRDDLNAARALEPENAGLVLGLTLRDDLLVARALAHKVEPVLHRFRAIWRALRPSLLGLAASAPRIWTT